MKKTILLTILVLLMCPIMSYAQEKQGHVMRPKPRGVGLTEVVGDAQLEVEYAFNATDISNENTYLDLHVLQAGTYISKHFSRFLELGDSLYDAFLRANPNVEGVPSSIYTRGRNGQYWSEYQYTEIFTANGVHTCYAWMPWAMERYNAYYTETANQQKWEIKEEHKTILGHDCQRATCQWRGRTFEAWFAADIPVRLGPWTFGGLPGLILKTNDAEHLYTWEAVSLRSGHFPIKKRDYKGFAKDTRGHIRKLQTAANRDHLKVAGARDRMTGMLKSNPHPYEPLELE